MSAAFTLELRRLPGPEPRYAIRYACRNGRAAIAARPVWSVAEASLRSNGHRDGLSAGDVLGSEFVFVGFELADNGKFQLWHGDAKALHRLPVDGPWVRVPPTPVQRSPFFSLDTDELEFERPWRRPPRPAPPVEPVTEPGVVRSRWPGPSAMEARQGPAAEPGSMGSSATLSGFFDVPGLFGPVAVPENDAACTRWEEREILALPEGERQARTRRLDDDPGEVSDLLRVVSYLRGELKAERDEAHRLQRQVAKLQDALAALVAQAGRG